MANLYCYYLLATCKHFLSHEAKSLIGVKIKYELISLFAGTEQNLETVFENYLDYLAF